MLVSATAYRQPPESRMAPQRLDSVRCHQHQAGVYMANRNLLSMLSKTKLLYSVQAKGDSAAAVSWYCISE